MLDALSRKESSWDKRTTAAGMHHLMNISAAPPADRTQIAPSSRPLRIGNLPKEKPAAPSATAGGRARHATVAAALMPTHAMLMWAEAQSQPVSAPDRRTLKFYVRETAFRAAF